MRDSAQLDIVLQCHLMAGSCTYMNVVAQRTCTAVKRVFNVSSCVMFAEPPVSVNPHAAITCDRVAN